ncbi:MAG: NAD(P)H-dependent oxidoreductase [Candidatus Palauibacterales bacterium]|nr:NAD(P)H-dependent oxidoreductase [Candidatus Palauibacterales bacterium]
MIEDGIRVAVLLGSVRPGNYTRAAAALVVDELRGKGVHVDVIDPAEMELNLPGRGTTPDAERMQEIVRDASALVLCTPEYHGGLSSVIKLMIENMGFPSAMSGKPAALLGVAQGRIGAIKSLEMLRSICSHVGCHVMPATISVANVRKAFDEEGRVVDPAVEKSVRGLATSLLDYLHRHVCPLITIEAMARELETV